MKTLKLFIFSLILILAFSTGVKAEFFSDVIVTSPNGIWTDSRAYSTLNAAITAVGANQRTIVIANAHTVTALTVPANVTLKFERDGSITNSGQLTINTKNIIADDHQIFTGTGDIDFAQGTIIKSSWFNGLYNALTLTSDDTVTMLITKQETLHTSAAVGNNVTLKWDSQLMLGAAAGITLSNIGQVEAGTYQIFSGAGSFRFRDGTNLNSAWFISMRAIINHVSTSRVTLTIQGTLLVDYTDTVPTNLPIDVDSQRGLLSLSAGITLTINSDIQAGPYQWFSGAGTVVLPSVVSHYPEWYSSGTFTQATIEAALTAIGTTNKATLLLRPGTWVISSNADWSAYTNVTFKIVPGAVLQIATATTLTIGGPLKADLYKIFDCVGTGKVVFGSNSVSQVETVWFGLTGAAANQAIGSLPANGGKLHISPASHTFETSLLVNKSNVIIEGDGYASGISVASGVIGIQVATTGQASRTTIRNIYISGAAGALGGVKLGTGSPSARAAWVLMDQVYIQGFTGVDAYGVRISSAQEVKITDCWLTGNYNNIYHTAETGHVLTSMEICGQSGYIGLATNWGVYISGKADLVSIHDIVIEENAIGAVYISAGDSMVHIDRNYIEDNGADATGEVFYIGAADFTFTNNQVHQNAAPQDIPIIRLTNVNARIEGNTGLMVGTTPIVYYPTGALQISEMSPLSGAARNPYAVQKLDKLQGTYGRAIALIHKYIGDNTATTVFRILTATETAANTSGGTYTCIIRSLITGSQATYQGTVGAVRSAIHQFTNYTLANGTENNSAVAEVKVTDEAYVTTRMAAPVVTLVGTTAHQTDIQFAVDVSAGAGSIVFVEVEVLYSGFQTPPMIVEVP